MSDLGITTDINEIPQEYLLICKDIDDILYDMNFKNKNEEILTKYLIGNVDKIIAKGLKEHKCMQLPLVGCFRYNPIDEKLVNHYKELKFARKRMSAEEYKQYARELYYEVKTKVQKEQVYKDYIKKLKKTNTKRYYKYCGIFGKAYADAFIYTLTLMSVIEFNQEVQDRYDKIANR